MRIFAISDIHVDFAANMDWVKSLSKSEYKNDMLILAGDISDKIDQIKFVFEHLKKIFSQILYIPGNHDLWVNDDNFSDSIQKFNYIIDLSYEYGILTETVESGDIVIHPVYGWYDDSFGLPVDSIKARWLDYVKCKWGKLDSDNQIADYFDKLNKKTTFKQARKIITFSHFLPRIDVMPHFIPEKYKKLYPVLGSSKIEKKIRELGSNTHIYGHSHINLRVKRDGLEYINNAYGYPYEKRITIKKLLFIDSCY